VASREEFLAALWRDQINSYMRESWIDNVIRESERRSDAPFADYGSVLKRLLDLGASRRDLSLLARAISYETTFSALYALNDPGVEHNDIEGLHESLLSADPSGMEGRPGSAPAKT
jgi:hypothetical protein